MANCRVCNAPVRWAVDEQGNKIPLDDHEERDYGPDRYRIVIDGVQPTVARIDDDSPLRTFADHRALCQQPRAM